MSTNLKIETSFTCKLNVNVEVKEIDLDALNAQSGTLYLDELYIDFGRGEGGYGVYASLNSDTRDGVGGEWITEDAFAFEGMAAGAAKAIATSIKEKYPNIRVVRNSMYLPNRMDDVSFVF